MLVIEILKESPKTTTEISSRIKSMNLDYVPAWILERGKFRQEILFPLEDAKKVFRLEDTIENRFLLKKYFDIPWEKGSSINNFTPARFYYLLKKHTALDKSFLKQFKENHEKLQDRGTICMAKFFSKKDEIRHNKWLKKEEEEEKLFEEFKKRMKKKKRKL